MHPEQRASTTVTFDDGVVDNEKLMHEEVTTTIDGCSELSSDDSEQENEPHAARLTSQQVVDHIEEVKEYFQHQQDDCSGQVLQLTEMHHKVIASPLKGARQFLIIKFFSS